MGGKGRPEIGAIFPEKQFVRAAGFARSPSAASVRLGVVYREIPKTSSQWRKSTRLMLGSSISASICRQ